MPEVTLSWFHVVALLGAIQGVFLTAVLLTKRQNRTANRLLAALIFAFTPGLLSYVYHGAHLESAFPHFFGIAYPLPFLFGPLVYLYAVTASDRARRLTRRDLLHFLPFALVVIAGAPIYLQSGAGKIALYEALQRGEAPLLIRIADPLKLLVGITYAIATLLFLQRHGRRVRQSYSHVEHVNLRWLLWLGGSAAAIWVMAVLMQLAESFTDIGIPDPEGWITLAVAAMIYAIGYKGLKQPEIFRYESSQPMSTSTPTEPARYERSGLSEFEAASLKHRLLDVMATNRPWQDPELTLADLADMLSTTPHKVSEVLNSHIGQSFYDFVNGYRVREVQEQMDSGKTLLTIAYEAGFASKSTFNEVFKKHTGKTPSAFRRTTIAS